MTLAERVQKVAAQGFTERQAGFLVTVMLHSGVCMDRQYCAFARIAHGRKTYEFFQRLVARGYATAYTCAHGRARIFHVHHKALYRAIGEANNRFRRPTPIARAVERLMLLDTVLSSPEMTWLATEQDKLAHFTPLVHNRLHRNELPHLTFGSGDKTTVRYFPDKLPIGVHSDGSHVFTYLVIRAVPVDFRAFLHRHIELLCALPTWRVRLLIPNHLVNATATYEATWREELVSPLRLSTVDELRWYFKERQRFEDPSSNSIDDESARLLRAQKAFDAPRFRVLYRSWLRHGQSVLEGAASSVLSDAIARRTGRVESHVLSHQYLHLSPLVATA
jgi:hypothetical protein